MNRWMTTLCRVHREYVDGSLVMVLLEPIARDQVVDLGNGDEFVVVRSKVPLAPLSVWEKS